MRRIELSGADGSLRDEAYFLLMAHCFFPESEADREQAMWLVGHESKRLEALGLASYRPSEICQSAMQLVEKRQAQLSLAGYVAISMCCLDNAGDRMTIQGAAKVVSEFAYEYGELIFSTFKDGEPALRKLRANGDLADLKKIFRRYRSVSHICAARVACGEYLENLPFLERAPDAEACLIQTAAYFQGRLSKAEGWADWNAWDVLSTRPKEIMEHPALLPTEWHVRAIFEPFSKTRIQLGGAVGDLNSPT